MDIRLDKIFFAHSYRILEEIVVQKVTNNAILN